jgi:hypothetical protein
MSRIIRMLVAAAAAGGLALSGLLTAGAASAGTYTSGSWTLQAPSTDNISAQVLQPINSDGSSVFSNKNRTIPVQYKVTDTQSFMFESLYKARYGNPDGIPYSADNGSFSAASYTPPAGTTVSQISSLIADYSWQAGTDHGGALRWSISTSDGNSIFVYYGDGPNFTSESAGNGTGINLLSLSDQRVDTTQYGGAFYDTWAHASSAGFLGNDTVTSVSLVLDAGWGGDQVLNLTDANVTVNGTSSTFTMPGPVTTQTNAAPMWLYLYKNSSATPAAQIDEALLTSTQGDSGGQFRQVDGKYIYNLPVSNLPDKSATFQVSISPNSDGSNPAGVVQFGLK